MLAPKTPPPQRRRAAADRARAAVAAPARRRRTPSTRWSTRRWRRRAQRAPASAGFVNAVLRRFVRERDGARRGGAARPAGALQPPAVVDRARCARDWPAQWQAMLAADNQHPPMTLRVNARRGDAARPTSSGWPRTASRARRVGAPRGRARHAAPGDARCPASPTARSRCRTPPRSAPRRCCSAAGLPPGARVLDACAAPGGKTAHLLELADLDVLALDSDPQRLARVDETLHRLGLQRRSRVPPTPATPAALVGRPAVRRDPARRAVQRLGHRAPPPRRALAAPAERHRRAGARRRRELLDALWPLLAPGGRLLYVHLLGLPAEGQRRRSTLFCNASRRASARGSTRRRPATCCRCPTMTDERRRRPARCRGRRVFSTPCSQKP